MPSTTYIVQPGDCLSSIAAENGFKDWTALYNHPDNADLKSKRKDPNILAPGDKVIIPEKEPHSESRATGARYTFKVDSEDVTLRIVLLDSDDKPLKSKKYTLSVNGKDFNGSTDGSGLLKQSIPPLAKSATLKLFLDGGPDDPGVDFPLDLGDLDPVETDSGFIQRLQNLGYNFKPDDSDSLSNAITAFQKKYNLDQNGNADSPTREKLRSFHDGT